MYSTYILFGTQPSTQSNMTFISKRLQVFVSSTFTDLIEERQAAVEAILTAGHIPAGMELFTAGDQSQMDVIKQWIDESDVYLLIVGGRYGSVEPTSGKSYTQLEYEYALAKDKPLFACVINDAALEANVREHGTAIIEMDNTQKMKDFRSRVLTRTVRFWDDCKDIKITIGETLSHFSRREDLVGWVRTTDQANIPALADEVARLSKENAELRSRLEHDNKDVHDFAGLTFDGLRELLDEQEVLEPLLLDRRLLAQLEFWETDNLDQPQLAELSLFGLLTPMRNDAVGDTYYTLSDVGKRFLNLLVRDNALDAEQKDEPEPE